MHYVPSFVLLLMYVYICIITIITMNISPAEKSYAVLFHPFFKKRVELSPWTVNLCPKSFCLHFILYLHVWIRNRIHNTDPDPQCSCIPSGHGYNLYPAHYAVTVPSDKQDLHEIEKPKLHDPRKRPNLTHLFHNTIPLTFVSATMYSKSWIVL